MRNDENIMFRIHACKTYAVFVKNCANFVGHSAKCQVSIYLSQMGFIVISKMIVFHEWTRNVTIGKMMLYGSVDCSHFFRIKTYSRHDSQYFDFPNANSITKFLLQFNDWVFLICTWALCKLESPTNRIFNGCFLVELGRTQILFLDRKKNIVCVLLFFPKV